MTIRPRRNRRNPAVRSLLRETKLTVDDLIWPIFVQEGSDQKTPIRALPGCFRWTLDLAIEQLKSLHDQGLNGVALFPVVPEEKKDPRASEAFNPGGLMCQSIAAIKKTLPDIAVFSDIAMDPFSSDGHDGVVKNGEVLNDETLEILAKMALLQAEHGADYVCPSDMMDGRVGYLRQALDENGYSQTGILSYAAKYASSFYGPFREALDSAPRAGDKKTYQMDPANRREASREVELDLQEGADIVMVKPALAYLDIISDVSEMSPVPVAAYNVSGEYAMVKMASAQGCGDDMAFATEILTAIKRAGADLIFSYHTQELLENKILS